MLPSLLSWPLHLRCLPHSLLLLGRSAAGILTFLVGACSVGLGFLLFLGASLAGGGLLDLIDEGGEAPLFGGS